MPTDELIQWFINCDIKKDPGVSRSSNPSNVNLDVSCRCPVDAGLFLGFFLGLLCGVIICVIVFTIYKKWHFIKWTTPQPTPHHF